MERSEGVSEWCGKDIEECEREDSVSIPLPAVCTIHMYMYVHVTETPHTCMYVEDNIS